MSLLQPRTVRPTLLGAAVSALLLVACASRDAASVSTGAGGSVAGGGGADAGGQASSHGGAAAQVGAAGAGGAASTQPGGVGGEWVGVGGDAAGADSGASDDAPGPRNLDENPRCAIPARSNTAMSVLAHGAVAGDGKDDAAAFQATVDAAGVGGTVYVPSGDFDLDLSHEPSAGRFAFRLKDGQTLWMDPNAVLKGLPSSHSGYALVDLYAVKNATIVGGQLVGDRAEHLGKDGESGMGIRAWGAQNLRIVRTKVSEFWGDGILLGRAESTPLTTGVQICGVVADHNRRQGLSVTGANQVTIEDSVFSNTEGTLPEGGIDIEPDDADGSDQIVIDHCLFEGNLTGVYFGKLPETGKASTNSRLSNSIIRSSRSEGIQASAGTDDVIEGNLIEDSGAAGILVKWYEPFVVRSNTIRDSKDSGIHVEAAINWKEGEPSKHQLVSNVIERSGKDGIRVMWTHDCRIEDNRVVESEEHGIELNVAHRHLVLANDVSGSGLLGSGFSQILLNIGDEVTFQRNVARLGKGHADYGIHVASAGSKGTALLDNDLAGSGNVAPLLNRGK